MGEELRVKINGENRDISDQSTVNDLVAELSLSPARIAIELNGQVIRRTEWMQTLLAEGDRLEIVHFVGGGCEAELVTSLGIKPQPLLISVCPPGGVESS